jgi:hypothetical protein
VRVGHRQAFKSEKGHPNGGGPFFMHLDFTCFNLEILVIKMAAGVS